MLCPVCKDTDHRLYDRGSTSTAMWSAPYWENGVYHSHDGNRHSSSYRCSNGHLVNLSSVGGCPAGDVERVTTTRISWKHDVCGQFGLEAEDSHTCSWCEYKRKDAFRKACSDLRLAYKALDGWTRRRVTFDQWVAKIPTSN